MISLKFLALIAIYLCCRLVFTILGSLIICVISSMFMHAERNIKEASSWQVKA